MPATIVNKPADAASAETFPENIMIKGHPVLAQIATPEPEINFEKPAPRPYAFDLTKMDAIIAKLDELVKVAGVKDVKVNDATYAFVLSEDAGAKAIGSDAKLKSTIYKDTEIHTAILAMDTQKGFVGYRLPSMVDDGKNGFKTVKTAASGISRALTQLALSGRIKVSPRKGWGLKWTYQSQVMPSAIKALLPDMPSAAEVKECKLDFERMALAQIDFTPDGDARMRQMADIRDACNAWAMAKARLGTVVFKRY